jgi:energy-coupling factor transport system ATP-binding protein
LLRAIDGLIPHRYAGTTTGSLRGCGLDPASAPLIDLSRHVGTVMQDVSGQFVALTVAEDVAFSLENQQVPREAMPERVRKAAALVGIEDHLDHAPQDLSGGQKQRVAIAGVLVDEVEVLLFDEPLAMLDPATGRAAVELIDALHRDHGTTVVIVEHRLEDVLHRDVDRIVLMEAGRVVADGPPDEIVASGRLESAGIRPPLHVSALAYAGAPVTAEQHPSHVGRMALTEQQIGAVRDWVAAGSAPTSAAGPAPADPSSSPLPLALELHDVGVDLERGPSTPPLQVLCGVSAGVRRGEIVGVVGSNGAGKSSLARTICGFVPTTTGTVHLGTEDMADWPLAQRGEHIGFVLQEPGQMISTPMILEEVALGLRARDVPEEQISRRSEHVLRVCGLWPFRSWPVSALSHGQKKRLTIASVLVLEPEVLILDEPTAGQDFAHYTAFMDFLASVNADGTTVLVITHDMHLALEYTDRVLVVAGGRLIADDSPSVVLTDPDVTAQADLVTTGLYTLSQRCGLAEPDRLVRRFVEVDRAARAARAARADGTFPEAPALRDDGGGA